jgi:hypothetical protein
MLPAGMDLLVAVDATSVELNILQSTGRRMISFTKPCFVAVFKG